MEGLALIIGATVLATIVVAGLGMMVGYQLGLRGEVAPIVLAAQAPEIASHSVNVDQCLDVVEIIDQRSRNALEIANRYRETAPPELLMSVDQLVALVNKLSQQLQQTRQARLIKEPAPMAALPAIATDRTAPAESSDSLSPEEMGQLTGHFNKRSSVKRRYPYDCHQTMFPIRGNQPDQSNAIHVRCHDISVHGISFFLPDEPDFEQLVISLGSAASPVFMAAEVIQSKSVYMHDEMRILIGCRFAGRDIPKTALSVLTSDLAPAIA